jgi:hypothetical protein
LFSIHVSGIVYVDSALPLTRSDKRPDRVEIDPLQMHNACVPVVDAANKRRAAEKTAQNTASTSVREFFFLKLAPIQLNFSSTVLGTVGGLPAQKGEDYCSGTP